MTNEMYSLFVKSRRFGLAVAALLVWLGWSGLVSVWDWFGKHLK
jgi:hypothetical protein